MKQHYLIILLAAVFLTACGGGSSSSGTKPSQVSVSGAGFYSGETVIEVAVRDDGSYPLADIRVDVNDLSGKVTPAQFTGYTSESGKLYIPLSATVSGRDNGTLDITAEDFPVQAEYIIYEDGAAAPTYRVYFERNGGSYVSTVQVYYAGLIVEPPIPIRQGYTFKGWYADEQLTKKWDFSTERVYAIMRLYAKWEPQAS